MSTITLRLPAPPKPPKPLHLTVSIRSKEKVYRALPQNWIPDDEAGGTVKGVKLNLRSEDDEEDYDNWNTAKTSPSTSELPSLNDLFIGESKLELDEPKYDRKSSINLNSEVEVSSLRESVVGSRKRRGGSTLRRKVGNRTSIFFDSSLENPLIPISHSRNPSSNPASTSTSILDQLKSEFLESSSPAAVPSTFVPTQLTSPDPLSFLGDDNEQESEQEDEGEEEEEENLLDLQTATLALSLHSFAGETNFGELTFERGIDLMIEVEDLGGGWSLGYVKAMGEESRGLIPRGWYAYIDPPVEVECISIPESSLLPSQMTVVVPSITSTLSPIDIPLPLSPISSSTQAIPFLPSTPTTPPTPPTPTTPVKPMQMDYDINVSTPIRSAQSIPESSPTPSNSSLPITSSNIRVRSIGRNVIISGIEFEPTNLYNEVKSGIDQSESGNEVYEFEVDEHRRGLSMFSDEEYRNHSNYNTTDVTSHGEVNKVEKREEEELILEEENFLSLSISPKINNLEVIEPQDDEPDHFNDSSAGNIARPTLGNEGDQSSLSSQTGYLPSESKLTEVESSPSNLISTSDKGQEESDQQSNDNEEDTIEAREERWAAVIAQADNPYFPSLIDSRQDIILEEDEEEEDSFPTYEEEQHHILSGFAPLSIEPVLQSPPVSSPPVQNSIFSRFGLSTVGRTYSSGSVGLGQNTYNSTMMNKAIGKGLVLDWIANGDFKEEVEENQETEDKTVEFHIEAGPSWKTDSPPFSVRVHTPETRRAPGTRNEYTSFQITTYFSHSVVEHESQSPNMITVERRYSHFTLLHSLLVARYPILSFPDLPPKTLSGRFNDNFIAVRRRDLERWLNRIGRHNVLRSTEEVRGFLAIEDDGELRRLLSKDNLPSTFFKRVYFPEFNFHQSEAEDLSTRFETHAKSLEIGGGALEIETGFGKFREKLRDTSNTLNSVAYSMVKYISGASLPSTRMSDLEEEVDESSQERARKLFLQNDDGALTWKDHCEDALSLTKAVQATAESMSSVAKLYDESARVDLLAIQELLRESSSPHSQHVNLLSTHKLALARHALLSEMEISTDLKIAQEHEEEISRCDTVVNITSAELERAHQERLEDLKWISEEYLRSQIEFHEKSLEHLKFAQSHFETSAFHSLSATGPRLKSLLERPLPPASLPLINPSNFGIPTSITARPVDVISSTVNILSSVSGSTITSSGLTRSNSSRGGPASEGKTMEELLKRQDDMEMKITNRNIENVGKGRETWRQSIFGSLW